MSYVSLICIDPNIYRYHFAPVLRISFKIYLGVDLLVKNSFYFLILNCTSFQFVFIFEKMKKLTLFS